MIVIVCCGSIFFFSHQNVKYNLVLITIDTLRADYVGYCNKEKQITPNIDQLAQKSVVFQHAYSHSPLTLPSHTSLLTGMSPHEHGVKDNAFFCLSSDVPTLATILLQQGYQTAAVVSGATLARKKGLARGFQEYNDVPDKYDDYLDGPHVGERIASQSIDIALKITQRFQKNSPYFLWLHLFDPHAEYAPPLPYEQTYEGEIAYTDNCLGKFLQAIQDNNTIIIFTADHGEGLGEHGEASHGYFLYQTTLHVPCFIYAPNILQPRIEKIPIRSMDIMPTALGLLRIKDHGNATGQNISLHLRQQTPWQEQPSYAETYYTHHAFGWAPLYSWTNEYKKYISTNKGEFYDLQNDPQELCNLSIKKQENMLQFQQQLTNMKHKNTNIQIQEEDLKQLQSLSYVSFPSNQQETKTFPDPVTMTPYITLFLQAQTALNNNQNEKAIQLFQQILQVDPKNVASWSLLGKAYAKQQLFDKALDAYKQFEKLRPQLLIAKKAILDIYFQQGNYEQARQLAHEIIRREGNQDSMVLSRLAYLFLLEKQYENAQKYAQQATLRDPNSPSAWFYLAQSFQEQNKWQQAISSWEKAIQIRSHWTEAYYHYGTCYEKLGNIDKAHYIFQKGLQNAQKKDNWYYTIQQQLQKIKHS